MSRLLGSPRYVPHSARRSVAKATLAASFVIGLSSCANDKASAIVVAISTELAVPAELDELNVKASRAGAPRFDQSYALPADAPLPGTLTFVDDDGDGPVTVLVRGVEGRSGKSIDKQVRFTIPRRATRLLRVRLDRACLGVVCDATDTCEAGRCVPVATRDGETLPPYTDDADAFRPAGCFDEVACADGARTVDVTAGTCAVASQAGENVFAVWRATPTRPTLVVLEASTSSLPPPLCEAWKRGDLVRVVASRACPEFGPPRELCAGPPPVASGVGGAAGMSGASGQGGAGQGGAGAGGSAQGGGGQSGAGGQAGAGGTAGASGAGQAGASGAGQAGASGGGQAGASGAGQAGASGGGQAGASGGGQAGASGGGQAGASGGGQAGASGGGGQGGAGQGGSGGSATSPPFPVIALDGAQERSCALLSNGDVYCWGLNSASKDLFGGAPSPDRVPFPTKVPGVSGLTSLTMSARHACGLDASQALWCWGSNDGFAVGGASAGGVLPPAKVTMPPLVQVVAGHLQTCGRDALGAVFCIGDVAGGTPSASPASISGAAGVGSIDLASSSSSSTALTCSLASSGLVHCWGQSAPVALPMPTLAPAATKVAVTRLDEVFVTNGKGVQRSVLSGSWSAFADVPKGALVGDIVAISAESELCVVTSSGRLFCVDDVYGVLAPGGFVERTGLGSVTAVSAAWTPLQPGPYSCAVDGADVWCWGDNLSGELGIGLQHAITTATPTGQTGVITASAATGATLIHTASDWRRAGETRSLRDAGTSASSTSFVVIPSLAGAVRAWAGDQEFANQAYAFFSAGMAARFDSSGNKLTTGKLLGAGTDWTEVWFDGSRVFGLHATAGLYSLGESSAVVDALLGTGLLPDGAPHAVATGLISVDGFSTYRDAYANMTHACAWDNGNGAATCWGSNSVGQCGFDPGVTASLATPPLPALAMLPPTKAMCAGWAHTCSVGADDLVRCWGTDYLGQLGRGTGVGSDWKPGVVVTDVGSLAASELVCGFGHTCALGLDAQVYCWGANDEGELGRGTLTFREDRAQPVPGVSGAQAIVGGPDHTCAIVGGARDLVCWGSTYWGQLGLGVRGFDLPPTRTIW